MLPSQARGDVVKLYGIGASVLIFVAIIFFACVYKKMEMTHQVLLKEIHALQLLKRQWIRIKQDDADVRDAINPIRSAMVIQNSADLRESIMHLVKSSPIQVMNMSFGDKEKMQGGFKMVLRLDILGDFKDEVHFLITLVNSYLVLGIDSVEWSNNQHALALKLELTAVSES